MQIPNSSTTRVFVIMPALDEERSVGFVIDEVPRLAVHQIIVVDNGSSDNTAAVALQHGATVVRELRRGYGRACLAGLAVIAAAMPDSGDIVVFLDSDYSDYPEEIPGLIAPILSGNADLCIGSRTLGLRERGALTVQQILGNRLACFLIWVLFGYRYTDLGPFRAISWSALQGLEMCDLTYGWTVEMQVKAVRSGLRIVEMPARYRRRIGQSKVSGTLRGTIKAGYRIIITIVKYAWR